MQLTIHHATRKKAEKAGIMLDVHGEFVHALHSKTGIECWAENATDALTVMNDLISVEADGDFYVTQECEGGDYMAFRVPYKRGDEPVARDPEIDDLFQTLDEMIAVGFDEKEDEEKVGGSVVPSKYKEMYRERGNENNCGDWLAGVLELHTKVIGEKGKPYTSIEKFVEIALMNGIEQATIDKLTTETRGWQGRLRMSVRNAMVKFIVAEGKIMVIGKKGKPEAIKAPADWLQENAPKVKAKKEKAAKAA